MQAARVKMHSDGVLTRKQLTALLHVEQRSAKASEAKRPKLLRRVQQLGFCEADLLKAERFIRDHAPLVIHLSLDSENLLQFDRYCSSMFEFETSDQVSSLSFGKARNGAQRDAKPEQCDLPLRVMSD